MSERCVSRLSENEACLSVEMCFGQMNCDPIENICLCEQDKFFSNSTLECTEKLSINQSCKSDSQCFFGLKCQQNKCSCISNYLTWDSFTKQCRLSYSKSCNSSYDCNSNENLVCSDFSNRCNCPSNSSLKICDCSSVQDK